MGPSLITANFRANERQLSALLSLLKEMQIPKPDESSSLSFSWNGSKSALANCYLAIFSVCHQTSPLGEPPLQGAFNGQKRVGWEYLKEKFLRTAASSSEWCDPKHWAALSPQALSQIYEDPLYGKTLNRINERTYLLNDLGRMLDRNGFSSIQDAFLKCDGTLEGEKGFLAFLRKAIAFQDPVQKKSMAFLAVAVSECGWKLSSKSRLSSPVDYNLLRGHLRLGLISPTTIEVGQKIELGLPLTEIEDSELRLLTQTVDDAFAEKLQISPGKLHYLFWHLFRACCGRDASRTHCNGCTPECALPKVYRLMTSHQQHACPFQTMCPSAGKYNKLLDPPYAGHYY